MGRVNCNPFMQQGNLRLIAYIIERAGRLKLHRKNGILLLFNITGEWERELLNTLFGRNFHTVSSSGATMTVGLSGFVSTYCLLKLVADHFSPEFGKKVKEFLPILEEYVAGGADVRRKMERAVAEKLNELNRDRVKRGIKVVDVITDLLSNDCMKADITPDGRLVLRCSGDTDGDATVSIGGANLVVRNGKVVAVELPINVKELLTVLNILTAKEKI